MSRDTQSLKPTPLLGFAQTFGNQRTMSDSNKSKDGQRPANNTGPNPKRRRTADRSDERSPVAQRDGAEISSPTVSAVAHRQRNPDASKQHVSNALPKTATHNTSAASLNTLMNLFSENFESFQLRSRAVRHLKRNSTIQEQSHHRLSDFSSASNLQINERKAAQEDIERADKQITEFCNKISPALRPILQGILESGGMDATPSSIPDKPMVSEAKLNTVQDAIKKELETSFKKDIAESQQSMKDVFQSQMSALKEALSQEYEQRFKSFKETLMQEWEERENSLKKTLTQEGEERVKSLKKSLAHDYEKRIADMKLSAREDRDQVADFKNALAKESEKSAALGKKVADLKTELDETTSGQRQKLESLVDQTHLDQRLQRLSSSQEDQFGEIRAYVDQKTENTSYIQRLERVELLSNSHKEKLCKFEERLNQAEDNASKNKDLGGQVHNLSMLIDEKAQQLSDSQDEKLGELEASLNRLDGENLAAHQLLKSQDDKLGELEASLNRIDGENLAAHQLLKSQDEKLGELEASLNRLDGENLAAHQLLKSQDDKLSKLDNLRDTMSNIEDLRKLEARMNSLADDPPRIKDLAEEGRIHLGLIEKNEKELNARLASLESMVSTLSAKEVDNIRTEMAEINQRLQNFNPKHESPPVSADSVRQAIWLEVEKEMENKANATKVTLANVQSGLIQFLKTEREEREALEAQCAEVTHQLLEAQQEATSMKSELSELKTRVNDSILKQDDIPKCIEEKFNCRIGAIIIEYRRLFEGVYMELQGLGAWQTNFTTKTLFKDILNYINATMPNGIAIQLRNLKQRMEAAETRIAACENGISNKRRKLPSGSSNMVNGDHADA